MNTLNKEKILNFRLQIGTANQIHFLYESTHEKFQINNHVQQFFTIIDRLPKKQPSKRQTNDPLPTNVYLSK